MVDVVDNDGEAIKSMGGCWTEGGKFKLNNFFLE